MFEILNRFFHFCNPENRRKFYGAIIVGVFNSLFMAMRIAAVAVMMQGVIETVTHHRPFQTQTIWISLGIMIASLVGAIVTKKVMSMWQTEGGYRTCAQKRIEIAEHLRYLPMGYFNAHSMGQIASVTTNTMELMGDVATRAVMLVMQGLLDTALIIVMIAFFDVRIALVALAGFAVFQLINRVMRNNVHNISDEKHQVDAQLTEKILEYIQGIAEVKAYNLTGKHSRVLNQIIERATRTNIAMELKCIPLAGLQSLSAKLTGVAIALTSIHFYLNQTMALPHCAVMIVCSFMLFSALESGGNYAALLRIIDLGVARASEILAVPTMDIDGQEILPKTADLAADHIEFSYDRQKIIQDLSLKIPQKTTTAIVGPSGGGKTTLCHLLARFWDVDQGLVTLDGRDVRAYSMDSLMQNYSFVFQNVYLFHDTIANNIRFADPSASMDRVIEAAKKACCHSFISALPQGYETMVGEGGTNLSGGERQRISIARAMLKDAPIIILDEATANIDPENERDLMGAIAELTREKTVIMIAHRLKTVRHAQQILVIDRGRIVESGSHQALMQKEGLYAQFIRARKEAVSWKL